MPPDRLLEALAIDERELDEDDTERAPLLANLGNRPLEVARADQAVADEDLLPRRERPTQRQCGGIRRGAAHLPPGGVNSRASLTFSSSWAIESQRMMTVLTGSDSVWYIASRMPIVPGRSAITTPSQECLCVSTGAGVQVNGIRRQPPACGRRRPGGSSPEWDGARVPRRCGS